MKTLYLECAMGAAGDMLAAALLELLDDPAPYFNAMSQLRRHGVAVSAAPAARCGITGTALTVTVHGAEEGAGHDHEAHDGCNHDHEMHHDHGAHGHDHHHAGLDGIQKGMLPPQPVNENLYTAPRSLTDALEQLPSSLTEAKQIARSSPFVTAILPEAML